MQLEFISNTGFYLEHDGVVIGMDIWLTQGPFEGSWFHYPPLRPTKFSVEDCDYIYISHIHPDHCDFKALNRARRDTTFIVPAYMNCLLERKLRAFGFKNVISLHPGEQTNLKCNARITLYGQFINNLFAASAFGSLIDSAILLEWDDRTILNCNDNYLDAVSARKIVAAHPSIDLALMPHSASGPYPASFRNLNQAEKVAEAKRLQREYIDHFVAITDIVRPRIVVPCAAEYVVVGSLHEKNPFIGLASADEAVSQINKTERVGRGPTTAVRMDCGTILNIEDGTLSGLPPRRWTDQDRDDFAERLKDVPFPYEWESECTDVREIKTMVQTGRNHIWQQQTRLDWKIDYNIYLTIDGRTSFHFNFSDPRTTFSESHIEERIQPYLECFLSQQLLCAILSRKAHWNNAEGGLHIDFFRAPNIYLPEVYTLMSFLHVPRNTHEDGGVAAERSEERRPTEYSV